MFKHISIYNTGNMHDLKKTTSALLGLLLIVTFFSPVYSQEIILNGLVDNQNSSELELFEPSYDYEYIPDASYSLVEDRISCIESEMPLHYNEKVKSFIDYFTIKDRSYTKMVIRRKELYFPVFEKYLKKYNLPDELKYLSIVESGLNPIAKSRVAAVGLWQFMPSTGRLFGLDQDWYVDERQNAEKSTEAACKYLRDLYNMFDDWELALAAYNAGPGNVRKAIRRSGYKRDFWAIYPYLPRETRSYVPQFVAIVYAMNYMEEHNLQQDEREYAMLADTLMVSQFLSLKLLAEKIDVCEEDLIKLNPELRRGAVSDKANNYPLLIPADKMDFMAVNFDSILLDIGKINQEQYQVLTQDTPGSTYGKEKVVYRVRRGDALGSIAQKYHVYTADLREWNNIKGSRIYEGQKLVVWTKSGNDNYQTQVAVTSVAAPKPSSSDNKSVASSTKSDYRHKVIYKVKSGDALGSIAERYHVYTSDLRTWNKISGNRIYAGQDLVIWTNAGTSNSINNQLATAKVSQNSNKIHVVQPGDSLWEISLKYEGVSIQKIKELNNLRSNKITPGQKLVIGK